MLGLTKPLIYMGVTYIDVNTISTPATPHA